MRPRCHSAESTLVDVMRERAAHQPNRVASKFIVPTREDLFTTESLTYSDLDRWARAIAVTLLDRCTPGDRVVILCSADLNYCLYLYGCLYAGVIPVPAYPLSSNRHLDRLESIARSSVARAVLVDAEVNKFDIRDVDPTAMPTLDSVTWIAADRHSAAGRHTEWRRPPINPDSIALIQYTSGSTTKPKGVVVSHRNLLDNARLIEAACGTNEDSVGGGWLPPYHDMGFISGLVSPMYTGYLVVATRPLAFIRRPSYWLEMISRERITHSPAPNFGYKMCIDAVKEDVKASLDLTCWTHAIVGSEAVRPEVLNRFADTFARCGFQRSAFFPCYGLAEATLVVSGGHTRDDPTILEVSSAKLERGVVDTDEDGSTRTTIVGSGSVVPDTEVLIVDPETKRSLPEATVGEVWIRGVCVTAGYYDDPEATRITFNAYTSDGDGPFLNPGDLGCIIDAELFIIGRTKEVMNFRGRKLHPQDIEDCIAGSHKSLVNTRSIAFSADIDDEERLIIVQQRPHRLEGATEKTLLSAIRRAVMDRHRVLPHDIVLVPGRAIPKTSSGKLQRAECRRRYLAGELRTHAS